MRDWIRDWMVDAYRLCTPAIRIAGGIGFGGWDLVEVVDLIGTIVGEICVTVGLGVGCFGVRSESFLGTRFLRSLYWSSSAPSQASPVRFLGSNRGSSGNHTGRRSYSSSPNRTVSGLRELAQYPKTRSAPAASPRKSQEAEGRRQVA